MGLIKDLVINLTFYVGSETSFYGPIIKKSCIELEIVFF